MKTLCNRSTQLAGWRFHERQFSFEKHPPDGSFVLQQINDRLGCDENSTTYARDAKSTVSNQTPKLALAHAKKL